MNTNKSEALLELLVGSVRVRRLKDCYLAVFMNECLEFLILVGCGCFGVILDLSLSILVLEMGRGQTAALLQKWNSSNHRTGPYEVSKYNLNGLLLLYYFFMLRELVTAESKLFLLFLLLMTNRLYRCEAMTSSLNMKAFLYKLGLLGAVIVGYLFWKRVNEGNWSLEGQWLGIGVFPFIIWLYNRFYLTLN